jgi:hypothetical protein
LPELPVATAAPSPIDPDRDDRKTWQLYEEGRIFKKDAEIVYNGNRVKDILRSPHLVQDGLDAAAAKRIATAASTSRAISRRATSRSISNH